MRSKWEDYLRLKHVARDLVKHKMEKERVEILQEMKANGGFNSRFFWVEVRQRMGRVCRSLEMMAEMS